MLTLALSGIDSSKPKVILKHPRKDMLQQIVLPNYNNELEKELLNLFHSSNLPQHFNHKGNKQFTNYQRISLIIISVGKTNLLEILSDG